MKTPSSRSLISFSRLMLATAAVIVSAQMAHADAVSYNCTQKIAGKTVNLVATVTPGAGYDVKLSVDGQILTPPGGQCFESNRPSTNYALCAFKAPTFELDLYPWARTTSGAINLMRFVFWQGDHATASGKFTNCATN